ncbi:MULTISPECIES: nucleotidyltransferase family protein [unclassified Halomonas]|uniref:nucleotidyltransferase family protein n=1 Tax=unclassified Halomonas TaxID=2609666 RepID=UPI0021E3AC8C|nr:MULTISPECIES: nucleotidyltransferase family protein [unclassified Halomonas]UYG00435.1 nucleotidyltransferase family protein [Halomonas sp. GD1P12]WNL38490.1 nucleotidyltransferase family protein [Halomonas sp. PAMB 3232]WNL41790.1 nucleotidyltransferase family protein [Halomonas sp. PAMB 3264]
MKKWEKALVNSGTSLSDAIKVLDSAALRIVLVVDEQRKLLGTLTDGDLRRALISHRPLESAVDDAMNPRPKVATLNWSRERLLHVMEQGQLLQLPIVDDHQRLIGLESLHDLLNPSTYSNPVFLMAGGFGTRLRPLTNDCPKPMLKVGDKPILQIIVESFIKAGFHRFYISTHYMPEMIRAHFGDGRSWGVSIQYIHEERPLGTGGALGLLPKTEIDQPLFLMNGDLLTTLNFESLLQFHNSHPASATMCVREYEHQIPYGVIQGKGHHITSMVEKPLQRYFVNAGIYLLDPELVHRAAPDHHIDMPTVLENEIAAQRKVNMFPIHEYWLDIGRMEEFARAQKDIAGSLQ